MPDCHGAASLVSGSNERPLYSGSRFATKFGVFAVLSVSSQPRRTSRATIQSVTTTMSHSVGRPAFSGPDRWVVKKLSLPSTAST